MSHVGALIQLLGGQRPKVIRVQHAYGPLGVWWHDGSLRGWWVNDDDPSPEHVQATEPDRGWSAYSLNFADANVTYAELVDQLGGIQ
jgi:hypothetical protein